MLKQNIKYNFLRQPGIEPGASGWQPLILPCAFPTCKILHVGKAQGICFVKNLFLKMADSDSSSESDFGADPVPAL
jgi:hypothetical protein